MTGGNASYHVVVAGGSGWVGRRSQVSILDLRTMLWRKGTQVVQSVLLKRDRFLQPILNLLSEILS